MFAVPGGVAQRGGRGVMRSVGGVWHVVAMNRSECCTLRRLFRAHTLQLSRS